MTKFVSKEIERELVSSTVFRVLLTPVLFFIILLISAFVHARNLLYANFCAKYFTF